MINDNRFSDTHTLAQQLADSVAGKMRSIINSRGRVSLAVSGGKTPKEFFQKLSQQELDWSKVLVTLVDDRWVDDTDEHSNARLVKENLLINNASLAYFVPLKNAEQTPKDGLMISENRLHEQIDELDIVVLGMGLDGHTASWFPESEALTQCLDEQTAACCFAVMDAPQFPQRMTMSLSLVLRSKHIYLHFEGDEKNSVYEQVCDEHEKHNFEPMPVRSVLFQNQVPVNIYRSA
jgi:6-phosphogluconolactonase